MFHPWFSVILAYLILAVIAYWLWGWAWWLYGLKQEISQNLAIPCHRCRYANPDYLYLKCTVHPATAYTREARDCSDFVV